MCHGAGRDRVISVTFFNGLETHFQAISTRTRPVDSVGKFSQSIAAERLLQSLDGASNGCVRATAVLHVQK